MCAFFRFFFFQSSWFFLFFSFLFFSLGAGEAVQGAPFRHKLLLGQASLHALEAAQLRVPIFSGAAAPAHGDDSIRGELVNEM